MFWGCLKRTNKKNKMKKSYRYKRLRYYKQKWAINTVQLNFNAPMTASASFSIDSSVLIENPSRNNSSAQSVNTASSILKCSHIKIKGVFTTGMSLGQSALLALMYCPEGVTPSLTSTSTNSLGNSIFFTHPEWVMSWVRMDFADSSQKNEFYLTSGLKRNLNPGDSIRLILYNINNTDTSHGLVQISATASYCCRAN